MNCEKVLDLIEEYIMGELDLETRFMMEKHLQECSVCTTEYKETEEVIRGVRNIINNKEDILNMSKIGEKRRRWGISLPSVAAAVFFAMLLLTSSVVAFPAFASTFAPQLPIVKQFLEVQNNYNVAIQENQEIKKLNEQIEQENKQFKATIKEIGGTSIEEIQTSEGIGADDNNKVQNLVIDFIRSQYKGDIENIKAMCTDEFKVQVNAMKDIIHKDNKRNFVFTQITNVSREGDLYLVYVRVNDASDIPDYQMNFELKKINEEFYVSFVGNDS